MLQDNRWPTLNAAVPARVGAAHFWSVYNPFNFSLRPGAPQMHPLDVLLSLQQDLNADGVPNSLDERRAVQARAPVAA